MHTERTGRKQKNTNTKNVVPIISETFDSRTEAEGVYRRADEYTETKITNEKQYKNRPTAIRSVLFNGPH